MCTNDACVFAINKYWINVSENVQSMMFKRSMVVFIPLILLVSYLPFAQSDSSTIVLNTDKAVYSIGMNVTVVGQVLGSFDPTNPMLINIKGPSGTTYHSTSISLDNTGAFTYEFVISDNASIGKSTLEATHKNAQGMISGTISFEVKSKASIMVQTSKTTYKLGENVILQGTVSPILPQGQVLIQVYNPKNNAWAFKSVSSDIISSTGQFSIELGKLDGKLSVAGVYNVKVSYADATATTTTSFSVGSDSADSSSKSSTESSSQSNTDSESNAPSKVKVADTSESESTATVAKEAAIKSEIKNNKPEEQEFTYIVLVKDSEGMTVSLSWAKGKLSPDQTMKMEQSWTPETAGIYTAMIFVWKSFENPEALSPVITKQIMVA